MMKMTKITEINFLDILIITTILLSITGYKIAKAEKNPLNKLIEGKASIAIEVLLPDVYSESNEFLKTAKKSAITIRNRPYTKLTITKSESKPKFIILPDLMGSYKTIEDPTKPNIKDYFITLQDTALKTSDGYVVGGNKIKIGNQIELEGFNYRLNGKIINIIELPSKSN